MNTAGRGMRRTLALGMTTMVAAIACVLAPAWAAGKPDAADGDWPTIGRTYDEQFFSPLKQIDVRTVKRLGLAWYKDLNTSRGLESTPLVIDGVMYNTAPFNEQLVSPSQTNVKARLSVEDVSLGGAKLDVGVWGDNLLNQKRLAYGIDFGALGFAGATFQKPVSYGIDARVSF